MDFKKVLLISALIGCSLGLGSLKTLAADPILLNPDQDKSIKFIDENEFNNAEKPKIDKVTGKTTVSGAGKTLSTKIQYTNKKSRPHKIKHKKPTKPVNIDKLIEYNDFEQADKLIQEKMNKNPKDVQARALWLISLAKQCKLDPAQKQLETYLKANPKNSDLHYAQGIVYFKRTTSSNMVYLANKDKLLNDALSEFKKAIELSPKDARYYNAAGVIAMNQGNLKDASNYFQKAVAIDKTYSTALDNLGTIDYVNGKFDEAQKKYNQALLYNTDNATAMYHLAQVATAKGDLATAAMHLNNAIYINPESYAAYNLAGEVYLKQGNDAASITAFKKAIALKPEFPQPYLNLAEIYEQRGDGEFAIEQLKTVLYVVPDFYDARLKIADISLANAKYAQAIEHYTKLVGVKDYNNDALKGLASAYYEQAQISATKALNGSSKDYFKALDYVNKAIAVDPNDLELYLAKLKLAKATNQPELTQVALQEIIGSKNTDLTSVIAKGEAYATLNDPQNAKRMFDLATTLAQSSEDDLYLAEIFTYQKQFDSAKKILQKVLAADCKNQQALSDIKYIQDCEKNSQNAFDSAGFYMKSKNYATAAEYLSRALAYNPNNANAYMLLGEIYEKQKNYPLAIENYKKYMGFLTTEADKNKIEGKIRTLEKSSNATAAQVHKM